MNIGEVIRVLRKKNSISQLELADQLGVSQSYLSKIEKNVREPSIDLLKKMAGILGVPQQLFFLLNCDSEKSIHKSFRKPLVKISSAINDILKAATV